MQLIAYKHYCIYLKQDQPTQIYTKQQGFQIPAKCKLMYMPLSQATCKTNQADGWIFY